jgi:hypothetical protein
METAPSNQRPWCAVHPRAGPGWPARAGSSSTACPAGCPRGGSFEARRQRRGPQRGRLARAPGPGRPGGCSLDTVSHGNQQRAQLIAALANDTDLLMLDEPFAAWIRWPWAQLGEGELLRRQPEFGVTEPRTRDRGGSHLSRSHRLLMVVTSAGAQGGSARWSGQTPRTEGTTDGRGTQRAARVGSPARL